MKPYILLSLFVFCFSISNIVAPAQNQTNSKQAALTSFLKTPGFESAVVSISVKDFAGKSVLCHNEHIPLTPASTLKALTTATALEILGANYTYPTYFGVDKDERQLIIKGTGDPTLGTIYNSDGIKQDFVYQSGFLSEWTKIITKRFQNKTTPLDIFVDDSYFGYQGISRKWIYEDIGNYYGAGTYGISIFDNTYELMFNTEDTSQAPKILGTKPDIKGLMFTNLLDFNSSGRDNGYITSFPMANECTLIGDIPSGKKLFTIKGAIPNPGLLLAQTLEEGLRVEGIPISKIETAKDFYLNHRFTNDTIAYNTFHVHRSKSLSEICRVVNVVSNNHYTEALLRTIGRFGRGNIYSSALESGLETLSGFWKSKNLNTDELFMYDGCGLAPVNAISADFLSSVLVYMQTGSSWGKAYLESFPLAGKEGTVRNLMKNTKYAGYLHVKSGSIAGVQAFTGYYIQGDKKQVFTIIVNKYTCNRSQVVKAIEDLLTVALE